MPIDYKKYPNNWKEIRKKILERAGNCCELCGAENYKLHWRTGARVVLTIHHKNYDVTDNREVNLIALCQRCHNILDVGERLKKRKKL